MRAGATFLLALALAGCGGADDNGDGSGDGTEPGRSAQEARLHQCVEGFNAPEDDYVWKTFEAEDGLPPAVADIEYRDDLRLCIVFRRVGESYTPYFARPGGKYTPAESDRFGPPRAPQRVTVAPSGKISLK